MRVMAESGTKAGNPCYYPFLDSIFQSGSQPNPLNWPVCKSFAQVNNIMDRVRFTTRHRNHEVCPIPCTTESIHGQVTTEVLPGSVTNESKIYLYYPSLDTQVEEEIRLFGPTSIIASIGGSLGLFLGFSCLDAAMGITARIQAMNVNGT